MDKSPTPHDDSSAPKRPQPPAPGALNDDQRYPSGHGSGSPTSGYRGDQANPNPHAAESSQDHAPPDLDPEVND